MSFLDRFKKKSAAPDAGASDEVPVRVEPKLSDDAAPWVRVDPETGEIHPEDVPDKAAPQLPAGEADAVRPVAAPASPAAPAFDPYGIGQAPFEMVPPEKKEQQEPKAASAEAPAPVRPAFEKKLDSAAFQPAPAAEVKSAPKTEPRPNPLRSKPDEVTKPVPRRELREPRPVRGFSVGAEFPAGPSEEELIARRRTKNRLVGAAVLMAALVVAAPFIMDEPRPVDAPPLDTTVPEMPEQTTKLELNAPQLPKNEGDVMVTESGLGKAGESVAKANLAQEARDSMKPKTEPVEKTQKTEQPAVKPAAKPAAPEKAQKPQAPLKTVGVKPPSGQGWYVQVMATSSERQAESAVKRITELGFPAYRVPVEKGAATLWRVRVGLYKDKKEAESVVGAIVLNGIANKPYVAKQ